MVQRLISDDGPPERPIDRGPAHGFHDVFFGEVNMIVNDAIQSGQTCHKRQWKSPECENNRAARHVHQRMKQALGPAIARFFPNHARCLQGSIANDVLDL